MASGDSVAQIKERLSIVDVVSTYVELQQAGKNFKGKSPFTNERTPSFYVSPDRGMYYCFSSNQGGDIFTFIQKMEGVEFKDALKILADKAGIELKAEDPQKKTERDRLHDALEVATRFFEDYRDTNEEVIPYLTDRGVTKETIASWRIGYAPGPSKYGWRELKAHMESKGFTQDTLLKAGLVKGAEAGKEPYDLFRDRVMFPICDTAGKVVAFSGRILSKDSEAPKYVNSPETELFNKSEILFGYDKAKHGIRHFDFSLVVEGQFDVVLSHQAGYTNAIAVSGTALTPHHVMLLQRLSNRAVLALDADRAGIAAVKRAADIMLPRGMDIKVANMVGGKDPADIVREDPAKLRKIIGSAKPVVEFLLDVIEAEKKDDRNFKLRVREEVLPFVARILNKMDQEHFEGVVAERTGTTKDAIHYEVERIIEKQAKTGTQEVRASLSQDDTPQVSDILKRSEDLSRYLCVLYTVAHDPLKTSLGKAFEEVVGTSVADVYASLDSQAVSPLAFTLETYVETVGVKQLAEEVADKLNELKTHIAKQKRRNLQEALKVAEEGGDEIVRDATLQALSEIQKNLSSSQYSGETFMSEH